MTPIGELTPAEAVEIRAALSVLPPIPDEVLDRIAARWAAMDAQAADARRRAAARPARKAAARPSSSGVARPIRGEAT